MAEWSVRATAFVLVAALFCSVANAAPRPFADWAAVVVAGDHYDSNDNPTNGFDNARHDVSRDLLRIGFSPANLVEFSVTPRKYRSENLRQTQPNAIANALSALTARTHGGCLIYFSSHGAPEGLVVGNYVMPPRALARVVDRTCGARPTVVVISACFSGVFVKPLAAPNRMILTAARPDRTSFGCGATNRYPYFDQCVLSSWPGTSDFPGFGHAVQACVAAREKKEHMAPPSEPQLWIGPSVASSLPQWGPGKLPKGG